MTAAAFAPLPRLCNLDRLLHAMTARGLDGIMARPARAASPKADEPRPYAVVTAREQPQVRMSTAR